MGVCDPCRHVHHHQCTGFPPCTCWQCHKGDVRAYAAKARLSTNLQIRGLAIDYLISVDNQRWVSKLRIIRAGDRVRQGQCMCGCGQTVEGSPRGRRKLYVDENHRHRVYDRRVRAERKAA